MKIRNSFKRTLVLGLGVLGLSSSAFAQISFTPINPSHPPENRPLFGGPPAHSRLPFDISPDQDAPAIFGMSLSQQGNFNIGFHAKMHKALHPENSDQGSSNVSDDSDEQPADVNLFAHSVLDKYKWDGVFNDNDQSKDYFRFSALSTLNTNKYGKALSGESINAITGQNYHGSLLVKTPDGCKYILTKQDPQINDGTVDYGFIMKDINKGCNNVAFPTEVHVDISKSNSIIQMHDESGLNN